MEKKIDKLWLIRHAFGLRAAMLAGLSVAILYFAVWPIYQNVRAIGEKIASSTKEESVLADKVSLLSGLDAQVLQERVVVLDKALPPHKDVVLYLSTIDGLSRELGLVFNSIKLLPGDVTNASEGEKGGATKKEAVSGGLSSLETEIMISGTKDKIYTFLRTIEESLPLMQIKDVKLNIVGVDQVSLSLKLGMLWASFDPKAVTGTISLFTQKEDEYFSKLLSYPQYTKVTGSDSSTLEGLGKSNLFEGITPQQ